MNQYLIATSIGGIQEMPYFNYEKFFIIEAESRHTAIEKYNEYFNCDYFYGCCMAEKVAGKINVVNDDVSVAQLKKIGKL